jgi:membrane protease YdiL (CAAX protease family)
MKTGPLAELSPFAKLVFVILLVISGFIIFFLAGIFLAIPIYHINLLTNMSVLTEFNDPQTISLLKYFQVIQSIGFFIVPALLAGWFFEGNMTGYLKLNKSSDVTLFFITIIIMFVSLPAINWIISVNEMMKLPAAFHGVEQWMKDTEDQAAQLTDAFLNTNTVGGLAVNLVMIAIIPAIGEEMLFRGILQRLFSEWFRNIHVAILFTAFIFGAIHLQFYGILPRMLLGILFGYLFWWSGSLWLPIFGHFLNNGSAVVISYLVSRDVVNESYEDFGSTDNVFLILGSVVVTVMCLFWVYKLRVKDSYTEVHRDYTEFHGENK